MTKFLFIIFISFVPSIVSAQILGPRTYEDCVLKGLKDASTESAVFVLQDACEKKFPDNKGTRLVSDCNLTWNGHIFLPGTPKDKSRYRAITFSTTTSMIFFPEQMDPRLLKEIVLKRKSEVIGICPGIKFDLEK